MLDIDDLVDIVRTMNYSEDTITGKVTDLQLKQFHELITKLYQCCHDRMMYQSERFQLPDAELRCLILFSEERYLTAKGIAQKMEVVKSRVSKIIEGLLKKKMIQRLKDPEDSRVNLLSLTPAGQAKINEINAFLEQVHYSVLDQMAPDQRKTLLTNLELLKGSMESVKEMMV